MNRLRPIVLIAWLLAAACADAQDPNVDPRLPATPADRAFYRALGQSLDTQLPPDESKFYITYADRHDPAFLSAAPPGFEQVHCERTASFNVVLAHQSEPVGMIFAAVCPYSPHLHELLDHEAAEFPKALARLPIQPDGLPVQADSLLLRWHLSVGVKQLHDGSTFQVVPLTGGPFFAIHGLLFDPAGGNVVVIQAIQIEMCDGKRGHEYFAARPICTDPSDALQSIALALKATR